MEIVTLIPLVVCTIAVMRWGTRVAFLYVFLPVLLLFPTYFHWTLRPFPSINFVDAALLPLGAGMLLQDMKRWRVTRTDLLVLVFVFTSGFADYHHGKTTPAGFAWFAAITTGLIPYMAGKLLIEQTNSRIAFSKVFVWLLSVSSFLSAYEYLMKRNPYAYFWNHFYPSQYSMWIPQVRWGFGRVAGPFSQSELAGMMVLTALLLALWVGRSNYEERARWKVPPIFIRHGKRHIWVLAVALFTTQARGPWIGAIIGVVVASIGLARRPLRRAIIVVLLFGMVGAPVYVFGKDYLNGPRKDYGSEKETAQYRAELITNYTPLAKRGGLWGWGPNFPSIDQQDSIDNEYLYTWIVQGSVGAIALLLLLAETLGWLVVQVARTKTVRDRHFVMTLLGIVTGITFTISTVFLGAQSFELFFLLIGWTQALRLPKEVRREVMNLETYRSSNEPALVKVYG